MAIIFSGLSALTLLEHVDLPARVLELCGPAGFGEFQHVGKEPAEDVDLNEPLEAAASCQAYDATAVEAAAAAVASLGTLDEGVVAKCAKEVVEVEGA